MNIAIVDDSATDRLRLEQILQNMLPSINRTCIWIILPAEKFPIADMCSMVGNSVLNITILLNK